MAVVVVACASAAMLEMSMMACGDDEHSDETTFQNSCSMVSSATVDTMLNLLMLFVGIAIVLTTTTSVLLVDDYDIPPNSTSCLHKSAQQKALVVMLDAGRRRHL